MWFYLGHRCPPHPVCVVYIQSSDMCVPQQPQRDGDDAWFCWTLDKPPNLRGSVLSQVKRLPRKESKWGKLSSNVCSEMGCSAGPGESADLGRVSSGRQRSLLMGRGLGVIYKTARVAFSGHGQIRRGTMGWETGAAPYVVH